ncbi:beta-galactosidase [Paenibacillus sp. GCM10027626]|uniref:beta-galactosidase n=1 Tax=Paenibacillus sp. GCM10027626 TaxID=3273411 RepID=UPI0036402323
MPLPGCPAFQAARKIIETVVMMLDLRKRYQQGWALLCLMLPIMFLFASCRQETEIQEEGAHNETMYEAKPDKSIQGLIGVAEDRWQFADVATGEAFVPFGANYYDPHTGWAPKLWEQFDEGAVEEHFKQLKSIHANVARVFFTVMSFMPESNAVSEEGLAKFDQMIALAKKYGIKLLMSGPDLWEGQPSWYGGNLFASENIIREYEHFWTVIGEKYGNEPAIFAWDLYNEPQIGWGGNYESDDKWRNWLQDKYGSMDKLKQAWGDGAETEQDFSFIDVPERAYKKDDMKLYDYQLFREDAAAAWTERMVKAIRTHDQNHLITIGMVNPIPFEDVSDPAISFVGFNPHKLQHLLDFMSVHYYPLKMDPWAAPDSMKRELNRMLMWLRYSYVGKPIMIGEFGWYGGGSVDTNAAERSQEEQAEWCKALIEASIGNSTAWATWPVYDTPDATDISKFGGLFDADGKMKVWGSVFGQLSQQELVKPRENGEQTITLPMKSLYTDYDAQHQMFSDIMDLLNKGVKLNFKLDYN